MIDLVSYDLQSCICINIRCGNQYKIWSSLASILIGRLMKILFRRCLRITEVVRLLFFQFSFPHIEALNESLKLLLV